MPSHIKALSQDELPSDLAEDFDVILKSNGYIPESYKVLAHRPSILKAFMGLSKAVIRDEGTIDPGFRFLICYIASLTRGCQYCQAHNIKSAARLGVDPELLDHIWEYEFNPLFTAAQKSALVYAQAAASLNVTDEIMAELKNHWTDEQIIEMTALISLFGWLNCFNDSLAVELDIQTMEWAEEFDLEEKSGWDPSKHLPASS